MTSIGNHMKFNIHKNGLQGGGRFPATGGTNMAKSSITQQTLALLFFGLTTLFSFGQEGPTKESPSKAQDKPHDLAWVEKRIQDWQPTKDERRFDQIGWAKDLPDALRLGKEKGRPIFVFTHKGHMQFGRC